MKEITKYNQRKNSSLKYIQCPDKVPRSSENKIRLGVPMGVSQLILSRSFAGRLARGSREAPTTVAVVKASYIKKA